MSEYPRYTADPRYAPMEVATRGDAAAAKANTEINQFRDVLNYNRTVDQQRIEDSRFAGGKLKALAPFMKSGVEYYEAVAKQTAKDKEVGAQFDALLNPDVNLTEDETLLLGERELSLVGSEANKLEEAGDLMGAEALRNSEMQIGQGVVNERGLLLNAKSSYAADISQLVNSSKYSRLYAQNPQAALELATKEWIYNNKLHLTTKSNFVEILGSTILSTNSYMATNVVSERVAQEKQERLAEVDRFAMNAITGMTKANSEARFTTIMKYYATDNNGIVTLAAARSRAAKMLMNAAAMKGEGQLQMVLDIPAKPGEAKASLGATYPKMAFEALEAARSNTQKTLGAKRAQIITETPGLLQGKSLQERISILNAQRKKFGNDIEGLRQFDGLYEDLEAGPDSFATFQKLQNDIASGQVPSPTKLYNMEASGLLTRKQTQSLITQGNARIKVGTEAANNVRNNSTREFKSILGSIVGSTPGPDGVLNAINKTGSMPISIAQQNYIANQFKTDLDGKLEQWKYELSYTNMSQQDVETELSRRAFEWVASQKKLGGKYYLGGLWDSKTTLSDPNSDEFKNVENSARQFGSLSVVTAPTSRTPLYQSWTMGRDSANELKAKYVVGAPILDLTETNTLLKESGKIGIINSDLLEASRILNRTPSELLNESARYHNLPLITPLSKKEANDIIPRGGRTYPNKVNAPAYTATAAQAVPAFIAAGYSTEGAIVAAAYAVMIGRSAPKPFDIFRESDYVKEVTDRLVNLGLFDSYLTQGSSMRKLLTGINSPQLGAAIANIKSQL
jgi:hypothetical protein